MASLKPGTRVRFTSDSLGVLDPDSHRPAFLEWHVGTEDEGTYVGPDERDGAPENWHNVHVERDGQTYEVPVHLSMIEPSDERERAKFAQALAAEALRT